MSRIRNVAIILSMLVALALTTGEALAQSAFCGQLQAEYRAALRQGGSGSGRQMVEVSRLQRQLAEADLAARRGNCQAIRFLFIRPRKSPQCPSIMAHKRQLTQQLSQARGGFQLFNRSPEYEQARLRDQLRRNGCSVPQYFGGGGYRTVCVRLCDGYYFPISFTAGQNRFETDAEVCQSMYARSGQAELFFYPTHGDVADAQSLTGERYQHQLYAFNYRSSFQPACAGELKEGIAALGLRYLNARQERLKTAAPTAATRLPTPTSRPTPSEDPETLANRAGGFRVRPIRAPSEYVAAVDDPNIRVIGSAYYADLFDITKPPPRSGPSFDLIGTAQAEERPPEPTLGAASPDVVPEAPETTVQ